MRIVNGRNRKRTTGVLVAAAMWVGSAAGVALGAGAAGGGGGGGGGGGHGGGGSAGGGGASSGGGHSSGGTSSGGTSSGGGTSTGAGASAGHAAGGGTSAGGTAGGSANTGGGRSEIGNSGTASGGTVRGGTTGGNTTAGRAVSPDTAVNRSGTVTNANRVNSPSNVNASGNGRLNNANVNGNRGYNPYVPTGNRGNYGVVYGNPYYPFSYGWNPGWYGSGYGNGYNNYPSTGYNNNGTDANGQTYVQPVGSGNDDAGTNGNTSAQQTPAAQPGTVTTATPSVSPSVTTGGSSVAAQAQQSNAVDKSPALISANGAVTQAQSTYNESRERALANLRTQPAYQQALSRRHTAAQAVGSAKAESGPAATTGQPSNAIVSAATAKLDAGDEVTKMEEQSIATDPAAASAKARLGQATADRDALKAQLTAQYQQSSHGG